MRRSITFLLSALVSGPVVAFGQIVPQDDPASIAVIDTTETSSSCKADFTDFLSTLNESDVALTAIPETSSEPSFLGVELAPGEVDALMHDILNGGSLPPSTIPPLPPPSDLPVPGGEREEVVPADDTILAGLPPGFREREAKRKAIAARIAYQRAELEKWQEKRDLLQLKIRLVNAGETSRLPESLEITRHEAVAQSLRDIRSNLQIEYAAATVARPCLSLTVFGFILGSTLDSSRERAEKLIRLAEQKIQRKENEIKALKLSIITLATQLQHAEDRVANHQYSIKRLEEDLKNIR